MITIVVVFAPGLRSLSLPRASNSYQEAEDGGRKEGGGGMEWGGEKEVLLLKLNGVINFVWSVAPWVLCSPAGILVFLLRGRWGEVGDKLCGESNNPILNGS